MSLRFSLTSSEMTNLYDCFSDAMKNTLNVVAKIKRMTNRLLVSGGYVDRLGRRRQPPTIVAGTLSFFYFF